MPRLGNGGWGACWQDCPSPTACSPHGPHPLDLDGRLVPPGTSAPPQGGGARSCNKTHRLKSTCCTHITQCPEHTLPPNSQPHGSVITPHRPPTPASPHRVTSGLRGTENADAFGSRFPAQLRAHQAPYCPPAQLWISTAQTFKKVNYLLTSGLKG